MRHFAAVDPDRGMAGDAVEAQLDFLPAERRIEPDQAAIPADAARAIALGDIGCGIERLGAGPIMRQRDRLPVRRIEIERGGATGIAGLDRKVGGIVVSRLGKGNVAFVEQPALVQRQPVRLGGGQARRGAG
jgi:hypothetical protein